MRTGVWIAGVVLIAGAATAAGVAFARRGDDRPIPTVAAVDLDRFMGDWYVIAHIPSRPERDAWNAVESYRRREDGAIATTFTFRRGSFTAPVKTMSPVGFVREGTGNAIWGMRFVWPIRAEYRIAWLDKDYTQVIVARNARDYAWIMARTPAIPDADYAAHVERLKAMGYPLDKLRRVPQQAR
ncbi:MAG: lipocalin family protein [Arenimonas sp.]